MLLHSEPYFNLNNLAVSPVFRKVDSLSEEESVYHKKISRVQQGIDGKVAGITYKQWENNSDGKTLKHT